jgi:hypothetical protein
MHMLRCHKADLKASHAHSKKALSRNNLVGITRHVWIDGAWEYQVRQGSLLTLLSKGKNQSLTINGFIGGELAVTVQCFGPGPNVITYITSLIYEGL